MKINGTAKRFAIYVFFDKDGVVDNYNIYFLKELKKSIDKLLIICNGEIEEGGLAAFNELADEVLVRPNKGYDITSYKIGIEKYGYDYLNQFDEVLITNSTFYGPLYPFSEMFSEMDKRDVDFWGITKFHEVPFDPFGTIKYGYIPTHIQSYWMVFRRTLHQSQHFIDYWKSLPEIKTYEDAIGKHEAIFTEDFSKLGYKWDVYVNTDDLAGYTYEGLRDFPRILIEEKKCPIMKRRSFFHEYQEAFSRTGGESTKLALDYIENELDYDTGLIYKNLLRLQNQADLKKRLHWNYVVSSKYKEYKTSGNLRVALVMHIYYTELAPFCSQYVNSMPVGTHVYITVPSEEKLEIVKQSFAPISGYNIEFRVVGNIGRDVAPFLVGCKDLIDKYDLICKVHDKKVYQVKPMSIGASWQTECFDNLLRNSIMVDNIIGLFESKQYLGMLTPPVPKHGAYYPTTGKGEWGENFAVAKQLAEQLGLNVNMDEKKEPVAPLGSMFWVRTKALKSLFEHDWQYDEFPQEPIETDATLLHAIERIYPFVVQHEGFYPGWVMSDHFASIEYTNWDFINGKLRNALFDKYGCCDFRSLLDFVQNNHEL